MSARPVQLVGSRQKRRRGPTYYITLGSGFYRWLASLRSDHFRANSLNDCGTQINLAFSARDRDNMSLRGLIPPAVRSVETELQAVMDNIKLYESGLAKYLYLRELHDYNEKLFFRVLKEYTEELMPLVYTPVVGEACLKYSLIFRRPKGLFLTAQDAGKLYDVMGNWPEKQVDAIVVTDGERILGLGDLGANGMGIPVGKLALYTALAGIHPERTLPVMLDLGTNNEVGLLVGGPTFQFCWLTRTTSVCARRGFRGAQYDDFVEEFMQAAVKSCGSSSSKIAAENHRFSNSGSESIPQPPPHQSQTSGSCISTSASTAFHSVLGSTASKTADEAASAAVAEADACGDDAGNQQYGDPWDTDQAAVALRLLRAEDNRKSPSPAHATPAAKGAPSTNEVARQPVYEAAFDLRRKQREPDQGLDRMVQSPVPLIPGLQQQPLAGPLHPVPSSCSSSEVSLVPGRRGGITGQPSPRDACCPGPTPHQGSSGGIAVSSSVQLQPTPTHRGSSSSGGGNPSAPTPATRDHDPVFRQASAAIDQRHPPPWSPISGNAPAGAIAVKRSIHAGVKALPLGSARLPRHSGHRNEAPPQNRSDHALKPPRAPPLVDSLPSYPCTASVAVAGLLASMRITKTPLSSNKFLFMGAGEASLGIAELLVMAMVTEGTSEADARNSIWMLDSRGLIVKDRAPNGDSTQSHKEKFAKDVKQMNNLPDIVKFVKPTVLIGASAQSNAFNKEILECMCANAERPVVFALSNPTHKAECTADAAYTYTDGKCVFASGSPFPPFKYKGKTYYPGQGNNAYIFPGIALAVSACGVTTIGDEVFLIAAKTVANTVTEQNLNEGRVYPPLSDIHDVSLSIAAELAAHFYATGVATVKPEPKDKMAFLQSKQYDFSYPGTVKVK
ncbi:hypothetical protein HPB49_000585 [Dermacentor silvarum]|uniref:Uncharacterized protein n=1 Tax=Dermacentor silvarum TaxID=543639 RepID=A0ACB8C6K9_DERSI|nr:hypothetical protein HPB49_000585 [Dermacentor silvarum]